MRLLFTTSLCILTMLPASLHAATLKADSKITAATVYTNRATLTRQAVIDVPKGAHTIEFTGLPTNLMPDSLRADGKATTRVTMGALTHKRETHADLSIPRERELNEKLEKLQDQRKVIEAEKTALTAKQNFINNLSKQAALRSAENIAEMDLNAEDWAEAATTIHEQTSAILKSALSYDVLIRTIDNEISKIRRDLQQQRTGQRSTYTVSIPVESDGATKLTVNLDYQVPNASWYPLYDARLNTESAELELIQFGAVKQNTGEDWTNIKLTLSTAQPHRGATLPALNPMWVSLWNQNNRAHSFSSIAQNISGAKKEARYASEDMALASAPLMEMEMETDFVTAEIKTGGFVSEYIIPGLNDVKADGSESKLKIGTFETENKLQVQIKPQLSDKAFLVARATLQGEAPILPGQVNLFRDGAYVGKMNIPLLRPEEAQDIGFGIDDQVSVKRNVLKDKRSEAGVISKDSVIERHFITEIKNLHTQPVDLVVLETIPVSQDEDITVQIMPKHTSEGYEKDFDDIKGLLRWNMPLAAQEQKRLNLGWQVSWPKDRNINGL